MKNKKLFAILTLVCFMMTLMPVAAFAAGSEYTVVKPTVTLNSMDEEVIISGTTGSVYKLAVTRATNNWSYVGPVPQVVSAAGEYIVVQGENDNHPTTGLSLDEDETANKIATVAADDLSKVNDPAAYDHSAILTSDRNASVDAEEYTGVRLLIQNKWNKDKSVTGLFIWATQGSSKAPVTGLLTDATGATQTVGTTQLPEGVYYLPGTYKTTATGTDAFKIAFTSAGTYTIHASFEMPSFENGKIADAKELTTAEATKTVEVVAGTLSSKLYQADVTLPAAYDIYKDVNASAPEQEDVNGATVVDGNIIKGLQIEANNVAEEEVVIKLHAPNNGNALPGKTLKISSAGAVEVSAEEVTTDRLGEASFKVSGNREGTYKVYVTCGQFEFTIEVQVGATQATEIECTDEPTNPIDVIGNTDLSGYVEFTMYDVNGNELDPADSEVQGWDKAYNSTRTSYNGKDVTGYVAVVSQPSASKITSGDLWFDGETIHSKRAFTAEGVYEFKVVLNNGNYATAKIEVKEFTTPVELVLEYPATVELGASIAGPNDLYWLDANKVEKKADGKVNLAATGYAVESFNSNSGALLVKGDEKYVGAEISVTAVDERYNLIDTVTIKVAAGASELAFATKTAEVNVNNKIRVNVVDSEGNVVALGQKQTNQGTVDISYVILDKPENARVFASTTDDKKVFTDGYFTMNLTSNTVGNVAVQAVLKYTAPTTTNATSNVVKYYTGTQIFAVGTGSVGDVVVMSIGSSEIIINDKKVAIDAAPIVQNDRTYVPFRALAEAFGAEVAYDEATQAVTAELNGVTVVMTIGSATYTVNGAEKTMDVAPFINGSRTMVPVRFAAEAFGIKVIPTYNPDGTTADILFNL